MVSGIIGRKLGMTQVFKDNGEAEAVTAVEAGPASDDYLWWEGEIWSP